MPLYIAKKWRFGQVLPMPDRQTDSQSKDSATQLLTKYKSGALVTQLSTRATTTTTTVSLLLSCQPRQEQQQQLRHPWTSPFGAYRPQSTPSLFQWREFQSLICAIKLPI